MTLKMIDSEENGKLVESIYKNILDKFEPGARQLITAGKAYLKALQGTSTAAKQYMEAVSRLAKQAQQGTWDATSDIGSTLLQFTDVYREIQQQHHHILKAFYVDVLVPLETNLEKDTKVIQTEQKKFQQQLRLRQDNYQKAIGVVKKQRKKTRTSRSSSNLEKELKNMQCLEDEKAKLDGFCEESLRNALTQERIRYGFVLERQCSLAKHHLAYHAKGEKLLQRHLDEWHEVAKTRDFLPEHIQVMFGNGERPPPPPSSSLSNGLYGIQPMITNGHMDHNLEDFFNDEHEDTLSMTLRKARSMDASSMDLRSLSEAIDPPDMVINGPPGSMVATSTMTRAKSDFNLSSSHQSLIAKETPRPRSMMVPNDDGGSSTNTSTTTTVVTSNNNRKKRPLSRALYSYLSSGEHQLSFHEGDSIAIVGERNKGWQYGENLRTRRSGWFPVAYTQMVTDDENEDDHTPTTSPRKQRALITSSTFVTPSMSFDPFSLHYPQPNRTISTSTSWSSQPNQPSKKMNWGTVSGEGFSRRDLGPPPPPPPPMPPGHTSSTISSYRHLHNHDTLSSLTSNHSSYSPEPELRGIHRSLTSPAPLRGVVANNGIILSGSNHNSNMAATSLHSSNDSGFCNEINLSGPQQPEPDYCDTSSPKELPNRENVFSTVKLRKTKTNDRSAPKIS